MSPGPIFSVICVMTALLSVIFSQSFLFSQRHRSIEALSQRQPERTCAKSICTALERVSYRSPQECLTRVFHNRVIERVFTRMPCQECLAGVNKCGAEFLRDIFLFLDACHASWHNPGKLLEFSKEKNTLQKLQDKEIITYICLAW